MRCNVRQEDDKMLSRALGRELKPILDRMLRLLLTLQVSPNLITVIGLLAGIISGIALAKGRFFPAAVAIAVAGICDLTDGMLARAQKAQTRFGGFLDSVLDRYADAAMYMGLIYFFAERGRMNLVLLSCIALVGTVMTSYSRARAESIIGQCRVGFMERPERVFFLMLGALFHRIEQALWVIAVLSNWTAIQRVYYTWKTVNRSQA